VTRQGKSPAASEAASAGTRFAPGEAVHVADRPALGHCRTPWYLRGKTGVVASVQGIFRNPEQLAYHQPGLPKRVLYKVRFEQAGIWDDYRGPAGDHLEADIYEHWLEPATGSAPDLEKAR
jgi:nitrile hydratase subunit beta